MAKINAIKKSEVDVGQADCCGGFSVDRERMRRAKDVIPPSAVVDDVASSFKLLAHPSRVRILHALSIGELCVCELSEVVGLSVSATSHQLSLLRGQRLVRSRSEGKLVHYSLSDHFVLSFLDDCAKHVNTKAVAQ